MLIHKVQLPRTYRLHQIKDVNRKLTDALWWFEHIHTSQPTVSKQWTKLWLFRNSDAAYGCLRKATGPYAVMETAHNLSSLIKDEQLLDMTCKSCCSTDVNRATNNFNRVLITLLTHISFEFVTSVGSNDWPEMCGCMQTRTQALCMSAGWRNLMCSCRHGRPDTDAFF